MEFFLKKLRVWQKQKNQDFIKFCQQRQFSRGLSSLKVCSPNNISQQTSIDSILEFSKGNWKRLIFLDLNSSYIGNTGCKYLSRTNLPLLEKINLARNRIESVGLLYLSKNNWKLVKQINLISNYLKLDCLKILQKFGWKQLERLILHEGNVNCWLYYEDMLYLVLIDAMQTITIFMHNFSIPKEIQSKLRTILQQKYKNSLLKIDQN